MCKNKIQPNNQNINTLLLFIIYWLSLNVNAEQLNGINNGNETEPSSLNVTSIRPLKVGTTNTTHLSKSFSSTTHSNKYEPIKFDLIEYDLANGLHIILYKNINDPNVVIGTKYHVGSKNEALGKTGYAHFFEHLLFHGSKNIPQGQFENIVMDAGGYTNAYTSYDVTYFYQLLPAHQYKLGLWLESERMLHPIITQAGINKEREIVKEEKRMRYDNKPLGNAHYDSMAAMYNASTYGHSIIGATGDLNSATEADFEHFFQRFYVPNNATLIVAGNIDIADTQRWIAYYFSDISKGKKIIRPKQSKHTKNKQSHHVTKRLAGLTHSSLYINYYGVAKNHPDALILELLITLLTDKNNDNTFLTVNDINKDNEIITHINTSIEFWEDVGFIRIIAKLKDHKNEAALIAKIDEEIARFSETVINEQLLQSIINHIESRQVDHYFHTETLADIATNLYLFEGNTQRVNLGVEQYKKITPADIKRVAKLYLRSSNQTIVVYKP